MNYTQDAAVSVSSNGTMEVDTYTMNDEYVGQNDFGQALYRIDGIDMTEDQLIENAGYFEADDDEYHNGYGYADDDDEYEYEDSLPEHITDRLNQLHDALGGETGAANFLADELLGIGESRMDEMIHATGQSREELQSHCTAVLYDMADSVNMDGDMLMSELSKDIATVRSMRSAAGTQELHEAISMAIAGDYHGAMTKWNHLRAAMKSIGY